MMQEILFKTLSLICDLNLLLKNYQAAKLAVKDLEVLQRNDSNTYLMKIRVLLSQIANESSTNPEFASSTSKLTIMNEVFESINQLQKTENFKFLNLLSILHDADEQGISDESFSLLVDHLTGFIEHNHQAINYSLM